MMWADLAPSGEHIRRCCTETDLLDNGLKEGRKVLSKSLRRAASDAIHAAGVHHGKVALLVSGAQLTEEVKRGVDDKVGPADAGFTVSPRWCTLHDGWHRLTYLHTPRACTSEYQHVRA